MRTTMTVKSAVMLGTLLLLVMFPMLVAAQSYNPGGGVQQKDDTTTTTTSTQNETEHELQEHRDTDGTVWIQTDMMTVRLSPNIPEYQFWYSSDSNGSMARFMVSYRMIVEFNDLNGDGVYQPNETIGFVPLEAFEWTVQTGTIKNDQGQIVEVYASYTKGGLKQGSMDDSWFGGWMPGYMGPGHENGNMSMASDDGEGELHGNFTRFQNMTLRFYAHIYMNDYHGNVSDDAGVKANYTVLGGVEMKVDIEIGNYPFLSANTKIAVLNYLRDNVALYHEHMFRFRFHDDYGSHEINSDDDMEHGMGMGEMFHGIPQNVTQGLSLVDSMTNTSLGFYRWVDKAVMTLNNGSSIAVDVGASYWTNGEALLLFFAYPNFDGGSLAHDPSFGVVEGNSPVSTGLPWITSGLLLGLGAIVVVAVIAVLATKRHA